ncbi:hypothetical protein OH76DRAFT_540319 [Lentinus brumalis]|uniref:Uncharacterized protein n=1 Tax=Lentinus brumalis TaxID=2498619 RepID=A0A371D9L9_9APHY|nr:hypothetical protein OH76DRAFT_540319 [Polyporus brumalis]
MGLQLAMKKLREVCVSRLLAPFCHSHVASARYESRDYRTHVSLVIFLTARSCSTCREHETGAYFTTARSC